MLLIEEKKAQKIPGLSSLFITTNGYNPELIQVIKNCDVKSFDKKTKQWEVPLTSLSYLLDTLINFDEITLKLLKDNIDENKLTSIDQQLINNVDNYNFKIKPFPHQVDAIKYGLAKKKFMLRDVMGLGKTFSAISLAEYLKSNNLIEHCLIICGLNSLKFNWKKEIETNSHSDCLILGQRVNKKGNLVIGSVAERVEQLKHPISQTFVITNIETLRDSDIIKNINKGVNKFDMIVLDEAHVCKNNGAVQTHNFLKLKDAQYKLALTGTLLLNSPSDAYVAMKWLGVESSPFSTFECYYKRTAGPFHNIFLGYRHLDVLKNQLEKYSLRRTNDILNLPDKIVKDEIIEMKDDQAAFYKDLLSGTREMIDKVKINATSFLALISRLRQATVAPSILSTYAISSAKLDRAKQLVSDIISNGDKVVVFSVFKESLYILAERLKEFNPLVNTGDYKDEVVANNIQIFQTTNNSQIFLGTLAKCSTGITLTAAKYMIFLDIPWTYGLYEQAQERIHRIGTKDTVFIYNLVTKDTIDEKVLDIVNDKKLMVDYITDDIVDQSDLSKLQKYIEDL